MPAPVHHGESRRGIWSFLWGAGTGALLAAMMGASLLYFRFGLGLVHLSYDLPYAVRPILRPKEAVMVYLDDDSHGALDQPYNAPWDRALHAQLIERLTAEGAKAAVFDIVFSDAGPNPSADDRLTRAIRANGKVVLAADNVPTGYGREGVEAKMIVPPYAPFLDAAGGLGSAELSTDDDLILRQHVPMSPDDQIPSMSWAAAKVLGTPLTRDEKNAYAVRWMNYYGPATTIPNVSFYRAVLTNAADALPAGFFSNKVVFVGAHLLTKFSGERKDEYPTPYSRWARTYPFTPGAEIQATATLNLIRGDWLNRLPRTGELIIILFCGTLIGTALVRFRPWAATGIALLSAAAVAVAAYLSFAHFRIWFPWLLVIVQILVALSWSIVFNSIQLYVQKRLLEQALARYLSPKLVKKFANRPDLLRPGANKQQLTVLFSDIANFTAISEGIDSDELAKLMNNYFERSVSECIHRTDGTVVKYIGDAIFAFWNAPEQQDDHAYRACQAALYFRNQSATLVHDKPLYTRIGLHTGIANVGNFGSSTRVDYTAIGENINLASRMEGLNKYLGTQVLITGDTERETSGRLVTRPLGKFRLKGFEKAVAVYELCGTLETAGDSQSLREAFAAALKLFQQKRFDEAEEAFAAVTKIAATDGPTEFYLKQIAQFRQHPPTQADWAGEIELKEK